MSRTTLRPVLHAVSAVPLVLGLLSWDLLRGAFSGAAIVAIAFEILRLRHPGLRNWLAELVPVFRPREARRPSGAMWLALGYAVAVWLPPPAALVGILSGALADPAASLVGGRWGGGKPKSWIGTAAAATVTSGVAFLVGFGPVPAASAGLAAAALERWPAGFDDNLLVAPGTAAAVWLLA